MNISGPLNLKNHTYSAKWQIGFQRGTIEELELARKRGAPSFLNAYKELRPLPETTNEMILDQLRALRGELAGFKRDIQQLMRNQGAMPACPEERELLGTLRRAEQGGISDQTLPEIMHSVKASMRANGHQCG